MLKKLLSFALILVFLSTSMQAKELNGEELLQEIVIAYGGKEQLKQLNVYEQFWLTQSGQNDLNASEYRMVMMPDYLRIKRRYLESSEIKVLDKKNGTIMRNGTIYKAIDSKLDAMKYQMLGLLSPIELQKKLEILKITTLEDFYLLTLDIGSLTINYYISKETLLLHKCTTKITIDSKEILLTTIYEEYKDFHGVMLAHKETKFIDDVKSEVLRLQETRFQEPLK